MVPVTYLVTILARDQKLTECQTIVTEALTRIEKPADVQQLTLLLADVYALDKQPEKASTLLLAACQKMPDDIPLMRRLLRAMYSARDTANLQQFVDRIKTVEGPDGWQWRYEQAKLWYAGDNFADYFIKAAALLKDNLASNPEDQLSRLLLAKWYERTDRLDMAISVYRQAMDQSPGDLNILVPAMTAMYRAERYSQVQEVLAGIPQDNLDDPRISRLLLQKHLREGELASAGNVLERLLTSDPENENDQLALALVKIRQDQDQQARDILNKMTDKNPDFVPATALLVELELKQKNNTKAIQICDDLVNRLDNQSAYRLRSKTHAALGDVAGAEADMKKAVALEPDRVRRFLIESEFYRSIGRFDTAATTIAAAVKELPDDFQLKKQAVLTLLDSPDPAQFKQGKQLLDEALVQQPDDIELRLRKAQLLIDLRTAPSTEEAITTLTAITDKNPATEAAWAILADMYLSQKEAAKAMDAALKGLTHIPASRALMLAKARAEALSSPMLAIPSLRLLLERYPRDNDIAVYLANTYSAADEYAKALKVIDDRLPDASAQDKQKLSLAKAAILYDNGNPAQAQQLFEQLHDALGDDPGLLLVHSGVLAKHRVWPELIKMTGEWFRRNPDKPRLMVIIAENLMTDTSDGAKQTARDMLDGMIAVKPDCIDALNSLAVINHGENNIAAAAALYEKVLKLDPDRLVAINNLAWIKCEYLDRPAEAWELVKRGLALKPDYVDLVDTSGMINYRLKQYDKAVEDFRRCIRLYPKNAGALAPTHLHLAKALLGLNKTSEAMTNLRLCLNADRDNGGLSPADHEEAGTLIAKLEGRN
jgi:tetratricopeptide (TPR) repeat protein